MLITRRQFLATIRRACRLVLALPFGRDFGVCRRCSGPDPSSVELMQAGPLGDVVVGKANAPVTIIEYASMTCSHCATFHNTTYPEMKKKYIDTGKVKYILREFPLDPLAAAGFMLARCAGNDKYYADRRDAVRQAEGMGDAEPDPAAAGARQAGRLHAGKLRILPEGSEGAGGDRKRAHPCAPTSSACSSTPTFFINGKLFRGTADDRRTRQAD